MRYSSAHAAKSGSVPFMLRGPKSLRTILSAAVAGTIAFAPVVLVTSPAQALPLVGFEFVDDIVLGDEGNDFVFEVTRALSDSTLSATDLDWTVAGGVGPSDATEDEDFADAEGELKFPADSTADGDGKYGGDTLSFTIDSLEDLSDEVTETFTVSVTDGVNTSEATGRIADDDDPPAYTLVVNDPAPSEDFAAGEVTVTAELVEASGKAVSIPLSTSAGTAKAGQDYTTSSATVTIAAGMTTSTPLTIPIIDDPLYEESEQSFTVKGAASTSVTGTETATVTITDDEEQSEINIAQDDVLEGGTLGFDVSLSPASERAVTAAWATADGAGSDEPDSENDSAKAGTDYTAATGTVTFPAATSNAPTVTNTAQKISVKTLSDSINEAEDEDMHVTLSSPTVGELGDDSVATGVITDNDNRPTATVTPTSAVTEGSSGKAAKTYTVKLNKTSGQVVSVDYDVKSDGGPGEATEVADFKPTTGTLVFQPGETTKTFDVDIMGDTMDEPGADETFEIDLTSTTSDESDAMISIKDDDATPTFTVAPIAMDEGDTGSVVVYPVKLSNPSSTDTTFTVTGLPGTATDSGSDAGDIDYTLPTAPVTAVIPSGQTTGYAYFLVNGDEVYESNEQMKVKFAPSGNITAGNKEASLTLNNDDDAPTFEVISDTGEEGKSLGVQGFITGVAQEDTVYYINFAGSSVSGSAAASTADFTNPGTVPVEVPGGSLSGTPFPIAEIPLTNDTLPEGAETILVTGTAAIGKVLDGVATIAASDGGTTTPTGEAPTLKASGSFRLGAGTVTLTGKAAAGAAVELWGRTVDTDDSAYAKISDTTAGTAGTFTFTPGLSTDGMYFMAKSGGLSSDAVRVNVKEDPDIAATSPSAGVVSLVVTGDPKIRGLETRVFRANANGTWTMVGSGILNVNGTFTKVLSNQTSGKSYTFRTWVRGNAERGVMTNYSSYSKTVRVK
jgi:hypothetical protein